MIKPLKSEQQALECLRLESACKQLAAGVRNPALQLHFTRMAETWNGLAEQDLAAREPAPGRAAVRA